MIEWVKNCILSIMTSFGLMSPVEIYVHNICEIAKVNEMVSENKTDQKVDFYLTAMLPIDSRDVQLTQDKQWNFIDLVKLPSHGEYEIGKIDKDKKIEKSGFFPVISRDIFTVKPGQNFPYTMEDKFCLGYIVGIAHFSDSCSFGWKSRVEDGKVYITFYKNPDIIMPIPKEDYVIQKNIPHAFGLFRTYFKGNTGTKNFFDIVSDWIKSPKGILDNKRKEEVVVSLT